jgi:hypothetical protein
MSHQALSLRFFSHKVFQVALIAFSLNLAVAHAQAEKRAYSSLNGKSVDGLVEQIKSIVNACQNKAAQSEAMRQMSYQSAYELALARARYKNAESGIGLTGMDYMLAQEAAEKSVEADVKEANASVTKCKETAKSGMDQEVKNLVSVFSSKGLNKEIKDFVGAWYTALQSVGTPRFKEQQVRMDSMAESLKLEAALRTGSPKSSK